MHSEQTINEYGQTVFTWTVSDGTIIKSTTTNSYANDVHPNGGEVEVFNGRLRILKFDHTWAQGAATELAIALQNAYGAGQQEGLRAASAA
jgi:hypothetical protein